MKMGKDDLSPSSFIGVQGEGIISFGSGQPDLPPPKEVFSCLSKYRHFQYGLIAGNENLREALAKKYNSTKDNFVITNGASEAIDLTFRAVAKPKDKILLHTPYYYSYKPMVEFNHFEPLFVNTYEGKIDLKEFEEKVHEAKIVLINSPSNPTGSIQDIETLKKIEKITADLGITLISDEVYKDLIYEGEHYPLSGDHVATIDSFSKTFSMCGFRVGYLHSTNKEILDGVVGLKTHTSMNTNTLAQEMAFGATQVSKEYVDGLKKIWIERRDFIYEGLSDLGLDVWKPEGAFYILPKIKNPRDFVWNMFKKHKIITYLGEWFGADDRVRFSYALEVEKIKEGLKRIKKYLDES
jgi:aspartate/methionine/tyrosine aminotransferase